jgi:hypothetical protein
MNLNQDGKRNEYQFLCLNGEVAYLKQPDIERWERKFDQIKVRKMLQQWEEESSRRPWLNKKSWFFTISGYLHKLNKERDMPYETNGEIVLFPTKEKRSEKSPDFTGSVEIHGNKYKLAAWLRKKGVISGTVGEIMDETARNKPLPDHDKTPPPPSNPEFDDVPF